MNFFSDRKNLIFALFIAVILLLLGNIILSKHLPVRDAKSTPVVITPAPLNNKFIAVLKEYGIKDEWIKKLKQKDVPFAYSVQVPPDLPITLIIKEMDNFAAGSRLKLIPTEKKINGITYINITDGNKRVLYSELSYNKEIMRETAETAILINESAGEDTGAISKILSAPENFGVMLTPSKENAVYIKTVKEHSKEYALLISDDIIDLDYKLSPSYSGGRLKLSIRSILSSFPDAVCYIFDGSSDLYNSKIFPFVIGEFEKRKIMIVHTNQLTDFSSIGLEGLEGFVQKAKQGNNMILISPADFNIVYDKIKSLKKKGYKFVNPSILLQKI